MTVVLTNRALQAVKNVPSPVQRAFDKQLRFLADNLHHPSLRAKKFEEGKGIWQARVTRGWRFYFLIQGDRYIITNIIPHPK